MHLLTDSDVNRNNHLSSMALTSTWGHHDVEHCLIARRFRGQLWARSFYMDFLFMFSLCLHDGPPPTCTLD